MGKTEPFTYGYERCFNPEYVVPERLLNVELTPVAVGVLTLQQDNETIDIETLPVMPQKDEAQWHIQSEESTVLGEIARVFFKENQMT